MKEHIAETRLSVTAGVIRRLLPAINVAAQSDANVLITGDIGREREFVARLIHARSQRRERPLVVVNCAGVPEAILECELFGHVRGRFAGAYRDKPGINDIASSGTVYLDNVGEMTPRMQAVLLRFLDTVDRQRVNPARAHARGNIRILAATHRTLADDVKARRFNAELYDRLSVVRITIPRSRRRLRGI